MGGESIPIGRDFGGGLDSTRARPTYLAVLYRWIFTVDHKKLGIFTSLTAFCSCWSPALKR